MFARHLLLLLASRAFLSPGFAADSGPSERQVLKQWIRADFEQTGAASLAQAWQIRSDGPPGDPIVQRVLPLIGFENFFD